MSHDFRSLFGRDITVVTYHHFSPAPCEATRHLGISTSPTIFENQLDYFQRNYRVVSLEQLLADDIPPNAMLITIDDAYKSAIEVAAPALEARRLPSVFFVNPGPVQRAFVPLDNILSVAASRLGVEETSWIASAGATRAGSFAKLAAALQRDAAPRMVELTKSRLLKRLSCNEADLHRSAGIFLAPEDLKRLKSQGVEIANHTMSHHRCGLLNDAELEFEIVQAKKSLEEMANAPVRGFSFPWGQERDATPAALDLIRSSGHRAAFLMHARRNSTRPARDIWFRSLLTNQTGWRLSIELSMLPRLRSLRDRPGAATINTAPTG